MRIETGDQNRGAEIPTADKLSVEDPDGLLEAFTSERARHILQARCVSQERRAGPAREHHKHLSGAGLLGEITPCGDERDTTVVDDALCTGAVVSAANSPACACDCAVDKRNHVGRVARIKRACSGGV